MAARARDFCRSHPSTVASQIALLAHLEELLRRAESLAIQERAGRLEELAAANRRRVLRRTAEFSLLRHLVRVGQLAGRTNPALAGKFYLRSADATHTSFLTSTKQMHALGEAHKEELLSAGLSESLLGDVGQVVTQFEAAQVSGREGRAEHVSARSELKLVADEAVLTVEQLNALNRYRFQKQPALLVAWEAARFIGPRVRTEREVPAKDPEVPAEDPEVPAEGGETPPSGGVAPAA